MYVYLAGTVVCCTIGSIFLDAAKTIDHSLDELKQTVIVFFMQSSAGFVHDGEINVASTHEGTSQNVPLLEHVTQPEKTNEGTLMFEF